MKQPPVFVMKGQEDKVCRLKKNIYGLKQAARVWNDKLNQILEKDGFNSCDSDPCLYKRISERKHCYVLVYVDDLIVAREDVKISDALAQVLSKSFDISSLGDIRYFLSRVPIYATKPPQLRLHASCKRVNEGCTALAAQERK